MDAIDCSLRLGFPCEMEAKFGNFSVAASQELVYAKGDEVFVNLDLDSFVLVLLYLLEVGFDVYVHGLVSVSC